MAYAMTKRGSQDNIITYEFICDSMIDMNSIENKYRTIGSVAVVLQGESDGLEVYIAGSNHQWYSLGALGMSNGGNDTTGFSFYICEQNEVSNGLPDISEPSESTIYLVPATDTATNDLFVEYIWTGTAWEKFGAKTATIDLSGYATKQEIEGFYTKPNSGIPAADLADTYLTAHQDISGLAPKASPVFTGSISLGRKANTTVGNNSAAIGETVTASGANSHAEGYSTTASGALSHAEGCESTASNVASHAEGIITTASGEDSHAEGGYTVASGNYAHAEGYQTAASGLYTHTEGYITKASNISAHAEGFGGTYTYNGVSYASEAKGVADHTEGYQTRTESGQPGNHAEGYQTSATGGAAHSEGINTLASGNPSHAEGYGTVASANTAHAEGAQTIASGDQSHAEGSNTQATSNQAHAEGMSTQATNTAAHAEGYYTIAAGADSHAEGARTTAQGHVSHAEGVNTIAAGEASHISGKYNIADNYDNWAEWTANTEYAIGDKVKVTTTANNTTVVKGYICKTANSDAEFTASKWTQTGEMNYAVIIGNGTSDNARSNAYALGWDGTGHFAGDVYVGCNNDSTGGSKVVTETALNALIARVAALETEIQSLRTALTPEPGE